MENFMNSNSEAGSCSTRSRLSNDLELRVFSGKGKCQNPLKNIQNEKIKKSKKSFKKGVDFFCNSAIIGFVE